MQETARQTEMLVWNAKLLRHLGEAFARILLSYKEIASFQAYTNRVSELMEALQTVNEQYEEGLIEVSALGAGAASAPSIVRRPAGRRRCRRPAPGRTPTCRR
jgi:hypothetical protein